jgi:hypothetical protein
MGFFALYRSLSPMTVRQRFRYVYLVGKKTRQEHRPPDEIELREILAEVLNEFDLVLRAVGGLTIAWAEVDMFLDYINGILALQPAVEDKKSPRTTASLDEKIKFLVSSFGLITELATLREKLPKVITELERLQPIRNDVVHGVAAERAPAAVRKVIRLKVVGKLLNETYKIYQLGEIGRAATDAVELRNKLIALFADTFRILHPDHAKQLVGSLSSLSTLAPPQLPAAAAPSSTIYQRHRLRAWTVILLINALPGILIGVENGS